MKLFVALFFIMTFSQSLWAFVDVKNSNFADTWIDYRVSGTGYQLKVQRTYNSRSTFDGLLGFGWCSDFETKLEVLPDSSVKITECGGGMEVNYVSGKLLKGKELNQYVEQLVSMSRKVNPRLKKNYVKKLRKDLKENQYLREALAKKLGIKGKVDDKTKLFARGRGGESVFKKGKFYVRQLSDNSYQKFDLSGKLVSMYDKNSNFLKLIYQNNRLSQVVDNSGKRLEFRYAKNGKVATIKAPGNHQVSYKYQGQDLIQVKNAWKDTYKYAYDKLHNLTKISFPDKSSKTLTYDPDKDLVLSLKDRNDCVESYIYKGSKEDPRNHYWSTITKKCGDKITNNSKYEFWHRQKSDGTGKYLHRVASNNNGLVVDVTYHDIFGKPITVKEGKSTTWYLYNKIGLIKEKKTPLEKIIFSYDPVCKKANRIYREEYRNSTQPKKATLKEKAVFSYDKPKCNLKYAINSQGVKVKVAYDRYGRISKLMDQTQKYVTLKYDAANGKPNLISRPGLGSIKIVYDEEGKLKDIKSSAGDDVATQVASVFNNLLEVVSPVTEGLSI